MVIGLPRSGTTWAANWLTTGETFCAHDPLWEVHYEDLDAAIPMRAGNRMPGIACTGLWRWADWLNRHPARKLILRRDIAAVRTSLRAIGLPVPDRTATAALDRIDGKHVAFDHLFDTDRAEPLWSFLTDGLPFDGDRHRELAQMNIQPQFDRIRVDRAVARRLAAELRQ